MRTLIITIIAATGLYGCQSKDKTDGEPKVSMQTTEVSTGEIAKIINATGIVRPDITVQVGSEVSGKLLSVEVDFNETVKKGDLLAVIDPDNFNNKVAQNRAQVENRKSDIKINEASLKRAQVNAAQAKRSLDRRKQLFEENAISQAQLEETERSMALAEADVELAQARLEGGISSLRQAEANLRTAQVELSRTLIRSPIDGVVIERLVDPGQTVAASLSAPELFKIAGDLTDIRVDAAIVESDVSGLDAGDPVTFSVDAYPSKVFRGSVEQLRFKSKTQSNIVTYTAVVKAQNPEGLLMPGMTANLQITTNSKSGILRIPAAAERFRPTPDQMKTWAAAKDEGSGEYDDPKTRSRLTAIGVSGSKADVIMARVVDETEEIRADIDDPTKTWRRTPNLKRLNAITLGIVKAELSTPDFQAYRRAIQADNQVRDAELWVKDGDKMRQVEVGLGLSDGAFVEVISGLSAGDLVVTNLSSGAAKGPPGRRRN